MALIHYWPLDEASGSIVADVVGDSDAAIINDSPSTIVAGRFGNARDGRGGSGGLAHLELWTGTPAQNSIYQYSLAFWMKVPPTGTLAFYPEAWNFGDDINPTDRHASVYSFFEPDMQQFTASFGDGTNRATLIHVADFADDVWHLIVARCDGTKTDLIVDGVQVATTNDASSFNLKGSVGDTFFGGNSSSGYMNYIVDDIAIWDHYLSDLESTWLWNGGSGRAANDPAPTPQPIDAYISIPGPLQSPKLLGVSDWTSTIQRSDQIYYAAEIYGFPDFAQLRLPISSWQATLQQDRSSYLQCVIPAADQYIAAISEVVNADIKWLSIKRGAVKPDGSVLEMEIARVRIQEMSHSRGPQRSTVTLSGYDLIAFNTYQVDSVAPGSFRTLPDVQTISAQNGTRVRCGIDWLLRPGMVAIADGTPFVVSYINFYVNATQEFMDVGEREL